MSSFKTLYVELPHRIFELELASFKFDSELVVQFCRNSWHPKGLIESETRFYL